jgi:lysophospholipase L1-like esterase
MRGAEYREHPPRLSQLYKSTQGGSAMIGKIAGWLFDHVFEVLLLVGLMFAAATGHCQRDNTFSVAGFTGPNYTTVAAKTIAAQNQCSKNTAIPCVIIFDPSLAVYPAGAMPTKCAQCMWMDYTGKFGGLSSGSTIPVLLSNCQYNAIDKTWALFGTDVACLPPGPPSAAFKDVNVSGNAVVNQLTATTATATTLAVGATNPVTISPDSAGGFSISGSSKIKAGAFQSGSLATNSALVFDGDSLTQGGVGGYAAYTTLVAPTETFDSFNVGQSGYCTDGMAQDAFTRVDPHVTKQGKRSIVVIWAGTNCLTNSMRSPDQTYSYLRSYADARRLAGFKVIVLTMISRTGTGYGGSTADSLKNSYNALLRANWRAFADEFVDFGATASALDADGAYSNTTYFYDGIHLKDAGYAAVASSVTNAINRLTSSESRQARVLTLGGQYDMTPLTIYDVAGFAGGWSFGQGIAGVFSLFGDSSVGLSGTNYFIAQNGSGPGKLMLVNGPGGSLNLRTNNIDALTIDSSQAVSLSKVKAGAGKCAALYVDENGMIKKGADVTCP